MPAVSVLVATTDPGSALPGLVRSIDAQTLPAAEFEVVIADASTDGTADRLRQLAGRRTNVAVLTADAQAPTTDRIAAALERAGGEHLLVLRQEQRLAPRALELLVDRARRTGADVVLGRVVTDAGSGCATLPDDADRLDTAAVDPAGCLALVRRALVDGRVDGSAALLDLPALAAAGTVSAVGRYACALEGGDPTSEGESATLRAPALRWEAGTLRCTAEVRLPAGGPPVQRAWLVARQGAAEVALPAIVAPGDQDGAAHTVSAVLDPRVAEGGHPLDDGPWDLLLRLSRTTGETTQPLTIGPRRSAVVAGRPYVVRTTGGVLQLDAGAARGGVVGRTARSRTSVAETVHGTLVTLEQPDLHVHGDAVLDARLMLGGLGLPGRLICRDGRARLEAHVGSVAGTSPISVRVGGGTASPTGLRLRFDGTGRTTFEDVPPGAPSAPERGGAPLVQRLRRRLPDALEPAARRLVAVPALRRAYRRLLSR